MDNEISYADGTNNMWARTQPWESAEASPTAPLRVNVVFTNATGTTAALKMAEALATDLGAVIKLVVAQSVPYNYDLDQPPVNIAFTKRLVADLARQIQDRVETTAQLYLCRNKAETLFRVLAPNALVVIGGRNSWWPTEEKRLARKLRCQGHEVFFTGC